jgi:hypothetical protein
MDRSMRRERNAVAWQSLLAAATLLVLAGQSPAAEAPTDGQRLLAYCDDAQKDTGDVNPFRAGYCMAFIEGALRGWEAGAYVRDASTNYCITPGVTLGELMRVVVKSLRENPSELRVKGEIVVIGAVQKAFPCPAKR